MSRRTAWWLIIFTLALFWATVVMAIFKAAGCSSATPC